MEAKYLLGMIFTPVSRMLDFARFWPEEPNVLSARPVFARNCKKACVSQIVQNRAKSCTFRRGERLNILRPDRALIRILHAFILRLTRFGACGFRRQIPPWAASVRAFGMERSYPSRRAGFLGCAKMTEQGSTAILQIDAAISPNQHPVFILSPLFCFHYKSAGHPRQHRTMG